MPVMHGTFSTGDPSVATYQIEEIESRNQARGQVDVVTDALVLVVLGFLGVGSSQDTGPRIQCGDDPGLGNRNSLLLHNLMELT